MESKYTLKRDRIDPYLKRYWHGIGFMDNLEYDDGEPTPWARRCEACDVLEHQDDLAPCPSVIGGRQVVSVCVNCFTDGCAELLGSLEIQERPREFTPTQLRICADLKEAFGDYDGLFEVVNK